MDEPGNAAKTLDAPSAEDSIELLVQQPCADVLGRLAMIAEPFSYYVAWIPGERNRKVDFWIRGTGNRFEVWPKTRTTAWVTTSRKSGLLRACIRGEVVAQSEGCLLKARIDEGFLQDYTKLGSILAIAFLLFILLLALVGSMVTG
ncbi:MAG: hypothetical protein KDI03_08370, partial [Anaerolineae bacterium]|nr:hypothetical protein [Anaerolineae bacterium]